MENEDWLNNPFEAMQNYVPRRLREYMAEQVNLGRSNLDVLNEIDLAKEEMTGIMQVIKDEIQELNPHAIKTQALYKWVLDPNGEEWQTDPDVEDPDEGDWIREGHCSSCLYLASLPPSPELPFPSCQETHGDTNCGTRCTCTVECINEAEMRAELLERIAAYKKRANIGQ